MNSVVHSVAGNTTMTHLFLGLPPRWIILEPYIPVVNTPPVVTAQELGVRINPWARALIFPNIGSYFGGDLIAGILCSGIHKNDETAILVDVGTNAEVVLESLVFHTHFAPGMNYHPLLCEDGKKASSSHTRCIVNTSEFIRVKALCTDLMLLFDGSHIHMGGL